jgi:hypothetical protein
MSNILGMIKNKKPQLKVVVEDVEITSEQMLTSFAQYIREDNLDITWKKGEFSYTVKLLTEENYLNYLAVVTRFEVFT